jgi:spore maturation protein CgeB
MRKPRDLIKLPSCNYTLRVDFNENKDDKKKYQCIILTLLDKHIHQVTAFQTGASSYQKWAVDWYPNSDTIVLNSGDIGTYAFHLINNNQLDGVTLSGSLDSFANSIFEIKYSKR